MRRVSRAAHTLAFVVIANRRHTDLFEWGQRTTPFTLAAEIQRRLLPPSFTCEADSFTLSAWLEPAASIGGDTFDYSLARDLLHLSITDAVGHGVHSALTATLCVGGLRNARRRGGTLLEQAQAANQALHRQRPGPVRLRHRDPRPAGPAHRRPRRGQRRASRTAAGPRRGRRRPWRCPSTGPSACCAHKPYRAAELDAAARRPAGPAHRRHAGTRRRRPRPARRLQDLDGLHPREVVRVLGDLVLDVAGHRRPARRRLPAGPRLARRPRRHPPHQRRAPTPRRASPE